MNLWHGTINVKEKWNDKVISLLRKVSIFRRLNLAFMLLLITATVFLTFFSFYKYYFEIKKNTNQYISVLAQNVSMKIEDILQEYEEIALTFYDDPKIITALKENRMLRNDKRAASQELYEKNSSSIESKLYGIKSAQKYIVNIQFVSPEQQYYMTEPNGYRRGGSIRDLDEFYKSDFYKVPQEKKGYPVWFDTSKQTATFYKNEQSIYGLANIMTLCVGIYSPINREFLGVLVLNIDLNAFSDALEGYGYYESGNTFLIGEEGVVMWFNPSISAPSFPKDNELFKTMQQQGKGVIQKEIGGSQVVLAYDAIDNTKIFAAHIVDMEVLLKGTYQTRNLCIAVLLGTVIACLIISYYVTKSISDPIGGLVNIMQKAGNGKWEERYHNSGNDEIAILGDKFNEMADKTNQLIEQVYISEIRRQEILLNWKNAKLDALLMQINPHFLYNTLDIIRWEAMYEANGESTVTQMIEKFSQLCRMGMRAGGKTITLKEGIEHAQIYLDVINFRHNDKILLKKDIRIDTEAIYIPQFMLQPIMENAVIHAFGDASKGYEIEISAIIQEDVLLIQVEDNGKGMTQDEKQQLETVIDQPTSGEDSIGLGNVNRRIRLFYGDDYGIKINSQCGEGTNIQIELPVRRQSEDMEKVWGGATKNGI